MKPAQPIDREECIEQAYFFRVFRERLAENLPAQDILTSVHEEILSTTRLTMAIPFLASELKHSGLISSGFAKLPHYFTSYQTFVMQQAEREGQKFSLPTALVVLEREATYKAESPSPPGLFVYQFETLCRNRLGYLEGVEAMAGDPFYDDAWRHYLATIGRQVGLVDFAELVYLRSVLYVTDQRRTDPTYQPPVEPIFGEKEGKIAKASFKRDPLYLFAALQRQLKYPEVPRVKPRDDAGNRLESLVVKVREMEARLKLLESEQRGTIDLSLLGKADLFKDDV